MSQAKGVAGPTGDSQSPDPVRAAVLARNPIVGEALGHLLRGAGYDARFLPGTSVGGSTLSSDGYQLLLLAPGFSAAHRRDLLQKVAEACAADLSVIELVTTAEDPRNGQGNCVLWPCSVERLCREISAVLKAPPE